MVPGHRSDGTRIIDPGTVKTDAEAAEPEAFSPGFLTSAQKAELIGKPYRVHADGAFIFERGEDPLATVVLEEGHFSRLYRRPRGLLSEEDAKKAADRLRNGLLWAGLAKSS